ncbi:uncharacterized protein LOC105186784 [Harpegnathos saltator]|uniref:NADH dehydrogenase [ubiquinone] 1 alpha subcomplex subunit 11 n=1 Tax=Harpegnathos saltator TaxID=610380 RepID=E2B585_HARSA|nr:uncharacterized protein LOC105186784 [Harpegnathos saltator]XP_011145539.1 uncharacterized protein LOC105186784 [Harpegnathos saltator]XP_011145548.1 uncharacterized protein LOC105186784 [Harpegnathos saltator]EFN89138.1 hypothetical protein EAI_09050 [Harpegnathos saltator]
MAISNVILPYFSNNWRYSSAPEGQKPFEKVIGLSKYGLVTGFGVGVYDCILFSQTSTFWNSVNVLSYWMLPFTAMCATFASVAYTTTKLRGKDGYANYVIASLATTGVFNHWQKNMKLSVSYGLVLMGCATVKKFGDLNDWSPLPMDIIENTPTQPVVAPIDWTLYKDPRGRRPWE